MYHSAKQNKPQYARILIMGEPGMGKTLLGSTSENTLILDLEGRAAHANRPRFTFTKDRQGLRELESVLKGLTRLKPDEDGLLHYRLPDGKEEILVDTVQLDSLDELQLNIDMALTSSGFDYWREMLDIARGIMTLGRMLSAHWVCIAHTRVFGAETRDEMSEVNLALQGQFGQQVPRWFDFILNLVYDPRAMAPTILTHPTVIHKKLYYAKDALGVFGGKAITLIFKDGRPDVAIMQKILDTTAGGVVSSLAADPDALIHKIEKTLHNATSQPIPASQFLAYCKAKGWEMGEGSELALKLTEEFGAGYDPQKGQAYIDYLLKMHGTSDEEG